jgi:hypothetical protein
LPQQERCDRSQDEQRSKTKLLGQRVHRPLPKRSLSAGGNHLHSTDTRGELISISGPENGKYSRVASRTASRESHEQEMIELAGGLSRG